MADSHVANRGGEQYTEPFAYCLYLGFFAGLIWGLVRWLAVAMNFTKVPAAFLADPWVKRSALGQVSWQLTGLGLFILMSIAATLVYYALLKKFRGPYPGLLFGGAWWVVFYAGIGPVVGAVPPLQRLGWNSIITDLCLFLSWGLFIGYSIAYEYHNEFEREPAKT